jgi:hypothetical protein
MLDPHNPSVEAMETYGEEVQLHATGTWLMNPIIVFDEAEKKQEQRGITSVSW